MATRRERVILDCEDNLSPALVRNAGAAKILGGELDRLSGRAVRGAADIDRTTASADKQSAAFRRTSADLNQYTGRLKLIAQAIATLGPGVIPILGGATVGAAAFAAQLGAVAGGAGVMALALSGVGDGLKALNDYQLDPTAENLEKLNQEFAKLGPSGEHFVRFLDELEPELRSLQMAARDGLLPGAEEGITHLLDLLPQVRTIIGNIADTVGDLASRGGARLAGPEFEAFFAYLQNEAGPILNTFGESMGFAIEGVADLMVAFGPLTRDFSGGLRDMAQSFSEWAEGLSRSEGFAAFVSYVRETGPQVLDTLAALADAMIQITQAAAPLGGPVLSVLETIAKVIAAIADSDFGTPIFTALAAMSVYSRAAAGIAAVNKTMWGGAALTGLQNWVTGLGEVTTAQDRAKMSATELDAANEKASKSMASIGKGIELAAITLALDALQEKVEALANGRLEGDLNRNLAALADGRVVGNLDNMGNYLDRVVNSMGQYTHYVGDLLPFYDSPFTQAEQEIKKVDEALAAMVEGGQAEKAAQVFAQIVAMGKESGVSASEVAGQFQQYSLSLENLEQAAVGTADPLADIADKGREIADSQREAAAAVSEATNAMREQRSEALRAANAELNYQAAIDDARKALKENGATVDKTTAKGRDNLRTLYALADGWNQQSDAAKNARGSLSSARQNFIQTAEAMGMGERAAKKLADRLFEIPPKRKTEIEVEADKAKADLDRILAQIARVQSKTVTITVQRRGGTGTGSGGRSMGPEEDQPSSRMGNGRMALSPRASEFDRILGPAMRTNGSSGDLSGLGDAKASLFEFSRATRAAGFHVADTFNLMGMLNRELKRAQKAYDDALSARDAAVSRRDSLASSISQGLGGNIWEGSAGSPWAAGAVGANTPAGAMMALQRQRDRTRRFIAALNTLKAKGVTGPVLAEIIGSGDVERAEAMAALDVGFLSSFSSEYNAASSELAAAGLAGGNAVEGDAVKVTQAKLDEMVKAVKSVENAIKAADSSNTEAVKGNGVYVATTINGTAVRGHRNGKGRRG